MYRWQFTDEPFEPRSVEDLVRKLETSANDSERASAAYELGELCFGRSFWSKRYCRPSREQREAMITATQLGRGSEKAKFLTRVLAKALRDVSLDVRETIVCAFLHIGPVAAEAAPSLRTVLDDSDTSLSLWAARALHGVTLEVEGPLRTSLSGLRHPEPHVRSTAAYSLELMGRDGLPAIDALRRVAESDTCEQVRRQAQQAADALGR
jgi:HEAT repeat protein